MIEEQLKKQAKERHEDPNIMQVVLLLLARQLRNELDHLESLNVITPVDVPTDWILAIVVMTKRNGNVTLCIDPKPLNKARKRNYYPLPIIDDILPKLAKARCFLVLDAKNGFWHVLKIKKAVTLPPLGPPGEDRGG